MASPGAWADPEPTYHGSRHSGEGPLKSKRHWCRWVDMLCSLPASCFLPPQVRIPSRVDKLESPPKQCDQEVGNGVDGAGLYLSSVPGLDGCLLYLTSLHCGCPNLGKAMGVADMFQYRACVVGRGMAGGGGAG